MLKCPECGNQFEDLEKHVRAAIIFGADFQTKKNKHFT